MAELIFQEIKDDADIKVIVELAAAIWRGHYTPIIGAAQVEYMLDKFQSKEAIKAQIKEGYLYHLLQDKAGENVGYFAIVPKGKELFLSKFYVRSADRGKGYGRQAMGLIVKKAKALGASRITLTVNRQNSGSIAAYQKMGFQKTDNVETDIGGGFAMCDYAMEKVL